VAQNPLVVKRECDRFRPVYYAAASGDFNPIHIDKEMAQMVGLPGNILHGMCTMAWAVEAAIDALGGDPGSLASIKVRFSRPVKIDDVVTLTATVDESKRVEIKAVDQEGNDVLKNVVAQGR
jgi:acyl dehydratase